MFFKRKTKLERIKERYTKGDRAKIYGKIKHPLRDKLREYLKTFDCETIFEFGCNAGYNILELSNMGKTVFGIDINKQAIEHGQKELKLNVQFGDENYLKEMKTNSFDLVFTASVLDHIPPENIDSIITHLLRICKKHLICSETQDEIDNDLFKHDYESYGFIPMWEFNSTKATGGNGCLYKCYHQLLS